MQQPAHHKRLPIAFAAGLLISSVSEREAGAAEYCAPSEVIEMLDAMVTVVDGPGSQADEQARWSTVEQAYLSGPAQLVLNTRTFDLTRQP